MSSIDFRSLSGLTQAVADSANVQRRFDSPFSRRSSDTASPTSLHEADLFAQSYEDERKLEAGKPLLMFNSQTRREVERLTSIYEVRQEEVSSTIFDETSDLRANGDNNVRARWLAQGIWREEWGAAWTSGSRPSENNWRWTTKQPVQGPAPSGVWYTCRTRNDHCMYQKLMRVSSPEPYLKELQRALKPVKMDGTRPYIQFCWQVAFEYFQAAGIISVLQAWESVKHTWIRDGIWQKDWITRPGRLWLYEMAHLRKSTRSRREPERYIPSNKTNKHAKGRTTRRRIQKLKKR